MSTPLPKCPWDRLQQPSKRIEWVSKQSLTFVENAFCLKLVWVNVFKLHHPGPWVWGHLCSVQSGEWRVFSQLPDSSDRGRVRTEHTHVTHVCLNSQTEVRLKGVNRAAADLSYSDGGDPKQERVFIFTAQDLDVGRVLLDAGMLRAQNGGICSS